MNPASLANEFHPCPKFPDGETYRDAAKATRKERKAHEAEVKAAVVRRDHGTCRVPGCREKGQWSHLAHRGMGGNRDGSRSTTDATLCLCFSHHQGPQGLDKGEMEVIPLTPAGCDGPLAFHWVSSGEIRKERRFSRSGQEETVTR